MKNIKVKLLFWNIIITVSILSIFSYVLLQQFHSLSIKVVDKQLMTVVNEINYAKHFYKQFDLEEFMIKNLHIKTYEVKDGNFKKIISTNNVLDIKNYKTIQKNQFHIFTFENLRVVRFNSNKLDKDIYIEVATTLDDKIDSYLENLKNILLILIPLLLVISIFIGYKTIQNSLIPVKKTIDEVKDIETHKLTKRLTPYTINDEIEELVSTFNFMLDKLDESFSKIKRFSNDVSHELKTPLTVIRGEIELGLRKDRSVTEYKDILNSVLEETKSLQELINSLLFLSKANQNEIKEKFIDVELDDVITESISINRKLIEEKSIKFNFKRFESVTCKAHPQLIKILVGNIIQNAIKYSHKDENIEIYLDEKVLKIKDHGIGIPKDELEHIFDRFYRVDKSRNESGYGLGLSIVKSIASIHKFKIEVKSKSNKYTEFLVYL